jgi:hypothetical protein
MAMLDVTELLTDPDFVDLGLLCQRNVQIVGNDGLAMLTPANGNFVGSVFAGESKLNRGSDGQYIKGRITIITKFGLIDGQQGNTADIVTWQRKRYTVTEVEDFSNWGAGFVRARCDLIPLSG